MRAGARRAVVVLCAAAVAAAMACTPSLRDGHFSCAEGAACPPGLFCHGDMLCYAQAADPDAGTPPPEMLAVGVEFVAHFPDEMEPGADPAGADVRGVVIDQGGQGVFVVARFDGTLTLPAGEAITAVGDRAGVVARIDVAEDGVLTTEWNKVLDSTAAEDNRLGDNFEDIVSSPDLNAVCVVGDYFGVPALCGELLPNTADRPNGVLACFVANSGQCTADPPVTPAVPLNQGSRRLHALAIAGNQLVAAGHWTGTNLSIKTQSVGGDASAPARQFAFRTDGQGTVDFLAQSEVSNGSRLANKLATDGVNAIVVGAERENPGAEPAVHDIYTTTFAVSDANGETLTEWLAGGSAGGNDSATSAAFIDGLACIAGVFEGGVDFGGEVGERTPNAGSAGYVRCAPIDNPDTPEWVLVVDAEDGPPEEARVRIDEIAVIKREGANDRLIVAGAFRGTLSLAGGVTVESDGDGDGFVLELDPATGTVLGYLQIGGTGDIAFISDIDVDIGGNYLAVAGPFSGQLEVVGTSIASEGTAGDGFVIAFSLP